MLENKDEDVNKNDSKPEEVNNTEASAQETREEVVHEVNEETTKAVEEVENSVAESAEKDDSKEAEIPEVDYTSLSLEELAASLKSALNNNSVQKIKSQVEAIKSAFNQKFGALLAEKKAAFLAEGGNSIDFQFSSPIKSEYNSLLSEYKKQRDAYYKNLEKELKENLEKRVSVIESLKDLIEDADASTMYKSFKQIQEKWQTIGPVPKSYYNDTWKIYHHHVERFYDLLHINNDLRDLDFRHNLEEKLKIIQQAEALANENDINYASKELQDLHKKWKEDIGPVAKEMREEVWHKFSEATKKIHDKRHNYFKEMRSKHQEIIDKKLAVIELINAYDTSNNKTHNDWQKSIVEFEKIRQQYFNVGKLPYNKSEEVWQKFKAATKKFNSAKNVFYKQEKSGQQENLQKKIALIELAESLKESTDWEMATNAMKKVQSDWKKIGHVPRKFSDDIWKRFKAACNHYFDRYHEEKNAASKEDQATVVAKKEFLDTLKETEKVTKESVLDAITTWRSLGRLPRNARHLEGKFNKQIDKLLASLSMDKSEVEMLKFTTLVDGYLAEEDYRKLDSEQLFVRKKIDESVREIQQLENNLGFFSNAKADNPLVINVRNQIDGFKEQQAIWKQKLSYLKKLDY
ncbi:chromosome segregation protein [Polaribacter reichenbachii]|uniref:Chromosome segregation protein n=1 Tax=Polaribacter reichenbachii TaxID=996801 RepID=A0A1B8U4X6_9FLAO|nr:DUF349 domain-containing protein [Polaribacter reichenbachii]APZ47960.1 chromosome segregation protein [Polaribacter reichenbachii]AUC18595.1 chromosome segregation protein [Polaribacter reichenbachii]OBY66889.1 chromosome segregation protein [Polaribacter reichenbachii]